MEAGRQMRIGWEAAMLCEMIFSLMPAGFDEVINRMQFISLNSSEVCSVALPFALFPSNAIVQNISRNIPPR